MLESAIRKEEQRIVEAMVAGDMSAMLKARSRLAQLEADLRHLRSARAMLEYCR